MRFFKYFLTSVAAVFICLPCASYPRDGGPQPADRTIKVDVPEAARAIPFLTSMSLDAPPGFKVSLFASNLGGVRMMAESSDGVIYAAVPSEGAVIALPDRDHDGVADSKVIFASGLNKPHSMVFIGAPSTTLDTKALEVTEAVSSKVVLGAQILVAETGALVLLKDTDNDMKADVIKIISTDLPEGGGHWTRTVAAGPDGYLYVSAGSSCNACEEKDQRRAAVLRFKPEGGKAEVFAKGLRNSVGIAFEPNTKELWGVDNGADWLGENLPPEELNRIVKGGDYGWPYCYG
ncbi:MAG: PQQ-dependent sugar dehydrogenase, partial [Deltaproteobacteria bacterium]|nr:PQQ-dependent sugar dehydrogenase [Deltaproteobacteria bacterium]